MGIELIRRNAMRALLPPADMATADWIEQNIFLPQTASALPGKMQLWEYQRGICDALDDLAIERITVLKSARIGYTALLSGIIAGYVANSPAPILAVQPTADDARDYAVDLEQVFDASPSLRGLLSDEADETGRSTMLNRRFAGGSLKFLAAKSPRNLRRHTAKILIMDEIDGFEVSQEGDPIELAVMRTLTFRDRKIIAGSTPVFDYGPATRLYDKSDKRIYECLCPSCDEYAEIKWADIRWNEGDPDSAHWVCPNNGCVVDEKHKPAMVANGRWRATAPDVKGHAGFKVNALISPHFNARWGKLAAEFLQAKKSPETLQTFTNLVLGEPWKTDGDDLDEHELFQRREAFNLDTLPDDVLFITAGVDCQDDRLEVVLMGHGRSDIYAIDHRVFWGPIDGDAVWQDLDALLRETWQHPNGGTIRVDAALIDSGDGGHTEIVNAFTRPRFGRRVVASKGVSGFSRPMLQRSGTKGQLLWLAGVDAIKSQLFARLSRGEGVRFSDALQPIYFEQLTSERRVVRYVRGRPDARFERVKGKRAETLDATVYAWAARQLIGINLDRRAEELASAAAPKRQPAVIKSA
ncbi:MAG: phage terminase large subunit family protein [Paracoccus sp. (in: a-proteobacteria)]|uniref:phage terminase large subunit family protein n=1 Tax=Paracoccus sp. TaxID=267 RepID=UPI0026DEA227|nr:terminase gpA endonuclease subunit [Paracoccus sp. (in: a-proteobacteria)]MDO5633087.1 phage terminase large subunit family protein [Paracoccus sp. (in: a-proteobacteria)]